MEKQRKKLLSKLPAINDLLDSKQGQSLIDVYGHQMVVDASRHVIDELRNTILNTTSSMLSEFELLSLDKLNEKISAYLESKQQNGLQPVVNATGIVVHTNLGRSLLSTSAKKSISEIVSNYSNLEIDKLTGERGSRYQHVAKLLRELTGAEAALVVNNNAAAVFLILSSLAVGKEAIISRGEMVEIGGSFRIPDVMKQSGVILREVGCTNKVHLSDYEAAINENTGLFLKVHTSNYKVVGFTEEVEFAELVGLGEQYGLPVVDDLGSGILVDLSDWGLSYEPTVQDRISAGVDVVSFSGDKMLGGPQAGIIVGKKKYIEKMRKHPLNRALRVDKLTLIALEATLKEYRHPEKVFEQIPTLKMITVSKSQLQCRAQKLYQILKKVISTKLSLQINSSFSQTGGGAFPLDKLPTAVIELTSVQVSIVDIAKQLRLNNPPIFTRIANQAIIFDLRTMKDSDFMILADALQNINLSGGENGE